MWRRERLPEWLRLSTGWKNYSTNAVGHRAINDKTPLKGTDLFRIYSMTKPVTAIAAMQLYERGAFHMSDPITRWLPELKSLTVLVEDGRRVPVNRSPTMQELLTHTAGFSYGFDPRDPVDQAYRQADLWAAKDLDEFVSKVGKLPLKYQPGIAWHYSISVDLTGLIVERISAYGSMSTCERIYLACLAWWIPFLRFQPKSCGFT